MPATYDKDAMLKDLREHACEVRFTKVNGEKRIMHCTLQPHLLPQNTDLRHLDEMHRKPENKEAIAVWDLQQHGWRSFRLDSVEYAQIIDGY